MERGRRGLVLRAELDRWRLGHPVEPEGDREAEPQAAVAGLGPHLLVGVHDALERREVVLEGGFHVVEEARIDVRLDVQLDALEALVGGDSPVVVRDELDELGAQVAVCRVGPVRSSSDRMHREAEVGGARHEAFEVAPELVEAGSLRSAGWLVGDLEVLTDVGVDRLEVVRAQGVEALFAHPSVDLAHLVPLEDGEAWRRRRGGSARVGAQHHAKHGREDEDPGDRPVHQHTSRRADPASRDSSAARPHC